MKFTESSISFMGNIGKHRVHGRKIIRVDCGAGAENFQGFGHVSYDPNAFGLAAKNKVSIFVNEKVDDTVKMRTYVVEFM